MKTVITLCLFSLLATSPALQAQSKADEEAARNLPKAFGAAWARHDGHELAKIMDDNVDFVNVGAVYLRGKSDFEKYHTRLLSGRFKDANLTPLETTVRFLNPTTAVIHWSWKVDGDKDFDGKNRPPRFGLMTMIAEKKSGDWKVVAGQNTNSMPGTPPEMQEIKPAITLPDAGPQSQR